jgi:hypothetical protein
MFQPNEFHHPRNREIPNILEKICLNLSKAFLEKYACSFELCLPSFTMQPLSQIIAHHPPPVTLLGRQVDVHRSIEVALIEEFDPQFVSRC